MNDTEPMPAVAPDPPPEPGPKRRLGVPVASPAFVAVAFVLMLALVACAYLRGENVALRGELNVARATAAQAQRAADRASLDAANARTALANVDAQPTDAPEPVDTPDPPDENDANR